MGMNDGYKKLQLTPEGSHLAKLYSIVDIGDQETKFEAVDKDKNPLGYFKIQSQAILTFEIQDELMEDGRPFVISQTYNLSLDDRAKLSPVILALLGGSKEAKEHMQDGTTIADLLKEVSGKAVRLSIIHKVSGDKVYANIGAVMGLSKSDQSSITPVVNPIILVTDVNNIDAAVLPLIPTFIQNKIIVRKNVLVPNSADNSTTQHPF